MIDTLRADRVGAMAPAGAGPIHSSTPNLDRWSTNAAVFRRAMTPAPFTMPAMAATLTGAYPDRTGVCAHEPGTSMAAWPHRSVVEAARDAGLVTAAIVSNPWLVRAGTGFDRGFSDFHRLYQPNEAPGSSTAARVTDEAAKVLASVGARRFFLWVHYFDPHMPYEPPEEFAAAAGAHGIGSKVMDDFRDESRDLHRIYRGEGYSTGDLEQARRLYDGEVRYVDHEIGRLLEELDRLGRSKSTIVVVVSDHGESLGEHGLFFAHDYTLYEELVHTVLMIAGPGVAPQQRNDAVSLIDVAPTLCRLASLACDAPIDGRDLLEAAHAERTLFAAATPMRSKGTTFDRLEVPGVAGRWTMALSGATKLLRIPTAGGPVFEMYDLAGDPSERASVASWHATERASLEQQLDRWREAMDAVRPASSAHKHFGRRRLEEMRSLGYLQ